MNGNFIATDLPSPITEFAISLASKRDTYYWASGTAVIVAPRLAITAKHVVRDHWERHEGGWPLGGEAQGEMFLLAVQVPEQGEACLWAVRRMWNSPHTDITFMSLVPWNTGAAAYAWRRPIINALPPAIGARIAAFGYHSSKIDAGPPIVWRHDLSNSFGTVTAIHHQARDSAMLAFPCFETDARFEGGMSGGPVFNEAGELCGLICSGSPPFDEHDKHTGNVATLWPCLGTLLDFNRLGHPEGQSYSAIELAKGGEMVVRNWERVGVDIDKTGAGRVWLSA